MDSPYRKDILSGVLVHYNHGMIACYCCEKRIRPPGESKQKDVRYLDIHEDDQLDEAQFAAWVKQASQLPGERM